MWTLIGVIQMRKQYQRCIILNLSALGVAAAVMLGLPPHAFPQGPVTAGDQLPSRSWMDKTMAPDRRADLLIEQLTLDEKISLVHGGAVYHGPQSAQPPASLGGAGYVPGIPRLGISDLQMTEPLTH